MSLLRESAVGRDVATLFYLCDIIHIKGCFMQTTFLFASPSLLSGIARILDICSQFDGYNESETDETADATALYSDFRMVGQDLQKAMESLSDEMEPPVNADQLKRAFSENLASPADHAEQKA